MLVFLKKLNTKASEMKKLLFLILLASTAVLFFNACKKEISCVTCKEENLPPNALAGTDQAITLPEDSATLDGSASTDPDGTIATFSWTKVSGPESHTIIDPDSAKTTINGLTEGTYQFELKVADVEGLSSRDTIQIEVVAAAVVACNENRSAVNVTVTPVGNLSKSRALIEAATAGTKILFAGGMDSSQSASSRVDIYDYVSNIWSTAELSEARIGMASATIGTKIFFAGGKKSNDMDGTLTSKVDIYDASTGSWSTAELSQARTGMAAVTLGELVFFAGGDQHNTTVSDQVDIYNSATNTWSTASLSEPRSDLEATVLGDKVYFAGGIHYSGASDAYASKRIDVYDGATGTWSTTTDLAEGKGHFASIAVGNKIFWAGGWKRAAIGFQGSEHVEIRDVGTNVSTYTCLSKPSSDFNAVVKGDQVVFYTAPATDNRTIDVYNTITGTWSVGTLSDEVYEGGIISVNNKLYVVKGNPHAEVEQSTMVATLEW
jgi:N-acetylneuraminic acid mutarotase